MYGKEQLKDENTIKELKRIYLNTYYVTNDATTKGDGSFENPSGLKVESLKRNNIPWYVERY